LPFNLFVKTILGEFRFLLAVYRGISVQYEATGFLPTASQHKPMTYTNCCIYRVVPPDDEQ